MIFKEKITTLDPNKIDHLIEESLAEGHHFVRKLKEEYINGKNRFDKYGES